mgnify:CR=1 FL=1
MAFISDQQWRRIEPFLARGKKVGRPRKSDRETLEAVLYVLTTGCRWSDLPRDMGSYVTAWRRFTAWKKDGTFDIIRSCPQACSFPKTRRRRGKSSPESAVWP